MRIDPDTTTETPSTPEPADAAAELSAAMDAGIAAATPEPAEPVTPEVVEPTAEPPVPGTPEALAAEQAAEAAKAEAEAKTPDAEIENQIAALEKENGKPMSEGGKNRFREMATEIKTLAPIRAELEKHGITDIAQLAGVVQNAKDGTDLVNMVTETGATADQFGATLNYLQLVNKGDPASLEQAWAALSGELADLAKIMGKEVPGVFDPLAEHADLLEDIENGDITRKRALEIVQSRTHAKIEQGRKTQAEHVTQRQTAEQQAQEKAQAQGIESLRAWEAPHLANPVYLQRRDALNAKVAQIRQDFPPAQWAAATQLAFDAIMAVPDAPAPRPAPGPIRPGANRGTNLQPAVYDNPDDALEAGIREASMR